MHIVDLSNLTDAQFAEYERRYNENLAFYNLTTEEAFKSDNGLIAKIASNLALRDAKDRRQPVWRRR